MKKAIMFFLLFCYVHLVAQTISVNHLTCEYHNNPIGIGVFKPRLGWQIQSQKNLVFQKSYQILVADDSSKLERGIGNIWDTKKVISQASIQIEYAGQPLLSTKTYYWKVRVWVNDRQSAIESPAAFWQMGLLTVNDWSDAKWITLPELNEANAPSIDSALKQKATSHILPILRKEFSITKPIKKATAFICGLGQFELSINGKKVGDHFLDPGWTNYEKYSQYVTFDITGYLHPGNNAVGMMLGNGFYYLPRGRYIKDLIMQHGLPKMIGKFLIDYADGSSAIIVSDDSWKTDKSPITFGNIYSGEDYDAEKLQSGWDEAGFHDTQWQKAAIVTGSPALRSQNQSPLRVMQTITPVRLFKSKKGDWVYDLGQNFSGIVQLVVKGGAGKTVKLWPAELIYDDSTINQFNSGKPYYFSYTLDAHALQTWQPRFSYYGFRYVQIEGAVPAGKENPASLPEIVRLSGLHTRNSTDSTGSFSCSDTLFNRIDQLIKWAIKSNMASVLTDCPHREKLGWLEQVHLMMASNQFNFDFSAFYTKTMDDMAASQYTDDGFVPSIAPEYGKFGGKGRPFSDSPEWGSAYIILPWYMYQWYGDKRILIEHYESMRQYGQYLHSKANNYIISYGLGDWYDIGPKSPGVSQLTSKGVTATAIWYYDVTILQKIALLLNKKEDASSYSLLLQKIKEAFNKKYYHPDISSYDRSSQTANAMALYMGFADTDVKEKVLARFIQNIRDSNYALTAGDIGFRYVMQALQANGYSNIIYQMNNRSNVPGYGYQLAKGATSLTESWAAASDASNNHLMLGHIMEWFYGGLGGIQQAENSSGFKHIVIKPEITGNIHWVKTKYPCPYGLIKSEWVASGSSIQLMVQIPANTTADIYFWGDDVKKVKTTGGAVFIKKEAGRLIYAVGSGKYSFTVN